MKAILLFCSLCVLAGCSTIDPELKNEHGVRVSSLPFLVRHQNEWWAKPLCKAHDILNPFAPSWSAH
jgi:starvation-inducible outer membrane lipoprotein